MSVYTIGSSLDFEATIKELKQILTSKNLSLFSEIAFSDDAATVGLTLNPEKLMIFGNPSAGTALMQENPLTGLDLPLKILVWQDQTKQTFVSYSSPETLISKYGLVQTQPAIQQMRQLLQSIVNTIGSPLTQKNETHQNLVGSWKVIACQLNSQWLPESIFREFRYNITSSLDYKIDWADLSYPQFQGGFPKSKIGKVSLNTDTSPNSIDLIPDAGPFQGQVFQGIVDIDHDVMKANFAFPGNPRPTTFSAKQGEVYEVWLRIGQ